MSIVWFDICLRKMRHYFFSSLIFFFVSLFRFLLAPTNGNMITIGRQMKIRKSARFSEQRVDARSAGKRRRGGSRKKKREERWTGMLRTRGSGFWWTKAYFTTWYFELSGETERKWLHNVQCFFLLYFFSRDIVCTLSMF